MYYHVRVMASCATCANEMYVAIVFERRRPRRIFLVKSTNPHHSESRDLERCAAYPVVTNVLSVVNNHWKTMF